MTSKIVISANGANFIGETANFEKFNFILANEVDCNQVIDFLKDTWAVGINENLCVSYNPSVVDHTKNERCAGLSIFEYETGKRLYTITTPYKKWCNSAKQAMATKLWELIRLMIAGVELTDIDKTKNEVFKAAYDCGYEYANETIEDCDGDTEKLEFESYFEGLVFSEDIAEKAGLSVDIVDALMELLPFWLDIDKNYWEGYREHIREALETAKMAAAVATCQKEVDDIILSANDSYETGYLGAALRSLEDINALCLALLERCGKISGCYMVPDDGFFPDISELYCCSGGSMPSDYADMLSNEIENLKAKIAA